MENTTKTGRIVFRRISRLPWVEIDLGKEKIYVPVVHDQALSIMMGEGLTVRIKLVKLDSKYFLSDHGYAHIIE